jgi:hypothetical protein
LHWTELQIHNFIFAADNASASFMKTLRFALLIASLSALLAPLTSRAQTTLSAGDIAFTMINANGGGTTSNRFSFVTFVDLAVNTQISFTDIGWNGSDFRAAIGASPNETSITYTVTTAVTKGTQVTLGYASGTSSLATTATNGTVAYTSNSQSAINYSTGGDSILAYQGTLGSSASFVAGLNYDTSNLNTTTGWSSNTSPTTSESVLPASLTAGVNAVSLSVSGSPGSYTANIKETVNAQLNFSSVSLTTGRTAAQWRTILNDPAMWQIVTSDNPTGSFSDSSLAFTVSAIPEPATATGLLGSIAMGAALLRRRRRNKA